MRQKNKIIIGVSLLTLALFLVLTMGINSASAQTLLMNNKGNNSEIRKTQNEDRVAMNSIFENNDYVAWQNLMENKVKVMEQRIEELKNNINQENFSKMIEMRKLMQSGEYEKAKEIRKELGLNQTIGLDFGMRGFNLNSFKKGDCPFAK